jgi:hypothetical protein
MKFDKNNILLWLSLGFVGGVIGRGIYLSIRKKGTLTDGNTRLDDEMASLVERIKKEPK